MHPWPSAYWAGKVLDAEPRSGDDRAWVTSMHRRRWWRHALEVLCASAQVGREVAHRAWSARSRSRGRAFSRRRAGGAWRGRRSLIRTPEARGGGGQPVRGLLFPGFRGHRAKPCAPCRAGQGGDLRRADTRLRGEGHQADDEVEVRPVAVAPVEAQLPRVHRCRRHQKSGQTLKTS